MSVTIAVENFYKIRQSAFKKRCEAGIAGKILLCFSMACLTGVMAQVRIPLPWTPVPITGQTFAVLLAGVLLGGLWGGLSQATYIILGGMGLRWFTGFQGGWAHLMGPTGGYIWGFILAALFIGYVSDKHVKSREFVPMFMVMSFSTFFLIFLPGLVHLAFWYSFIRGASFGLSGLLMTGLLPFIPGAFIKITIAAVAAKALTPKKPYI